MIAYYLQVPLRYAIRPMSSRSSIRDGVTRQYQDNPEFPLYSKGNDRFRFDYGVFLLNKDVEQLMNYVGLNVSNLRNTLPNVKILCQTVSNWRSEGETLASSRQGGKGLTSTLAEDESTTTTSQATSPSFKKADNFWQYSLATPVLVPSKGIGRVSLALSNQSDEQHPLLPSLSVCSPSPTNTSATSISTPRYDLMNSASHASLGSGKDEDGIVPSADKTARVGLHDASQTAL
ncbi:hypothetical protein SeMB42_g03847 [Synchytrium endobioticum]|uniref:Uncharacterized protein n=1 Tax=Synchytrium endobioticum TaxID=286115 RepID=A0A507D3Z0_9FUNG|nr:hypothetical protein SeMB42_g03847 [Synchytrium endobioticum]